MTYGRSTGKRSFGRLKTKEMQSKRKAKNKAKRQKTTGARAGRAQ